MKKQQTSTSVALEKKLQSSNAPQNDEVIWENFILKNEKGEVVEDLQIKSSLTSSIEFAAKFLTLGRNAILLIEESEVVRAGKVQYHLSGVMKFYTAGTLPPAVPTLYQEQGNPPFLKITDDGMRVELIGKIFIEQAKGEWYMMKFSKEKNSE